MFKLIICLDLYMLIYFSKNVIKVTEVWLGTKPKWTIIWNGGSIYLYKINTLFFFIDFDYCLVNLQKHTYMSMWMWTIFFFSSNTHHVNHQKTARFIELSLHIGSYSSDSVAFIMNLQMWFYWNLRHRIELNCVVFWELCGKIV